MVPALSLNLRKCWRARALECEEPRHSQQVPHPRGRDLGRGDGSGSFACSGGMHRGDRGATVCFWSRPGYCCSLYPVILFAEPVCQPASPPIGGLCFCVRCPRSSRRRWAFLFWFLRDARGSCRPRHVDYSSAPQ